MWNGFETGEASLNTQSISLEYSAWSLQEGLDDLEGLDQFGKEIDANPRAMQSLTHHDLLQTDGTSHYYTDQSAAPLPMPFGPVEPPPPAGETGTDCPKLKTRLSVCREARAKMNRKEHGKAF